MKAFLKLLGLAVAVIAFMFWAALSSVGCSGAVLQEDPLVHRSEIRCVARYVQLTPTTMVGYDGCGNVWVKDTLADSCQVLSADGMRMLDCRCPQQGEPVVGLPN